MRRILFSLPCVLLTGAALAAAPAAAPKPQGPAGPSYCINGNAEFYPYTEGENCRRGYQIGAGNCRLADGNLSAIKKEDCTTQGGAIELPAPATAEAPLPTPKIPAAKP